MDARRVAVAAVAAFLACVAGAQDIQIQDASGSFNGTTTALVGSTSTCGGGAVGAANSVCLTANTITGEGATADAFKTLLAFGDATASQTLTCSGSASLLTCTVASPAVPTNSATVGNGLTIAASPAIPNAGAGTDGAARGGDLTLKPGIAARDTSGNADAGNVIINESAGIGTGHATQLVVPVGVVGAPGVAFAGDTTTGIYGNATFHWVFGVASGTDFLRGSSSGVQLLGPVNSLTAPGGVGASTVTYVESVEVVATTKTPGQTEAPEIYTNTGDTDGQAITLTNDPTIGECFDFYLTATDASGNFSIAPSAGETIQAAGSSCATSYTATAKGNSARICAVTGGSGAIWGVMSFTGTWICT